MPLSIEVRDPHGTKRVIEAINACLGEELTLPFQLQRLAMLMEPEPGNPQEIEGVLKSGSRSVGRTDFFTCSPGSWRKGTFPELVSPA